MLTVVSPEMCSFPGALVGVLGFCVEELCLSSASLALGNPDYSHGLETWMPRLWG